MMRNEAAKTLKLLAQGFDPITGEALPSGGILSELTVVRALFLGAEALQQKVAACSETGEASRQGKPWSEAEDERLRIGYTEKMSPHQLAQDHRRSLGAIKSRLVRLGLCEADPTPT
ncbi:hypothetical protein [Thauera mechernichensis]